MLNLNSDKIESKMDFGTLECKLFGLIFRSNNSNDRVFDKNNKLISCNEIKHAIVLFSALRKEDGQQSMTILLNQLHKTKTLPLFKTIQSPLFYTCPLDDSTSPKIINRQEYKRDYGIAVNIPKATRRFVNGCFHAKIRTRKRTFQGIRGFT